MRIGTKLHGSKTIVRDLKNSDIDFAEDTWFLPEVNRYLSDPSKEYADEKYYEALKAMPDNADGYYLIICDAKTGKSAGTCCMFPSDDMKTYDIGYAVTPKMQRHGYALEAVRLMEEWIHRHGGTFITCEVAEENTASNAMIRKAGFKAIKKSSFRKWHMETEYTSNIYRKELNDPNFK